MQCPLCDMQNQLPGVACSHCGKVLPEAFPAAAAPAAEPVFEEAAEPSETVVPEAEADEELVPEDGHVDNVGDESETETIVP